MLKDIFGRVKDKVKENLPQVPQHNMNMKICMVGPRGVGKTSVVTSMYHCHKDAVMGTNMFITPDGDTSVILNSKRQELQQLFSGLHSKDERLKEGGIPGDAGVTKFGFRYGLVNDKINIGMEIVDYPGEFLISEPETVAGYINEADVVMIVIDTPCLMEEDGRYNSGKNACGLVMDFIMKHLARENEKLVLFVPLKCEKYYADGTIDEVTERIQEVYNPLITFLRDRENEHGLHKKICCAITPIQTLGSVVFDGFETDADGSVKEIMSRTGDPVPLRVHYRYSSVAPEYSPQDCAQPLYYLLSFFTGQYEQMRQNAQNSRFFKRMMDMFRLIPNIEQFHLEASRLAQKRCEKGKGYRILFGKGRMIS